MKNRKYMIWLIGIGLGFVVSGGVLLVTGIELIKTFTIVDGETQVLPLQSPAQSVVMASTDAVIVSEEDDSLSDVTISNVSDVDSGNAADGNVSDNSSASSEDYNSESVDEVVMSDSVAEAKSEVVAETAVVEAKTEAVAEAKIAVVEVKSEAVAEAKTETAVETKSETAVETKSEAEDKNEVAAETETNTETGAESEIVAEADTDTAFVTVDKVEGKNVLAEINSADIVDLLVEDSWFIPLRGVVTLSETTLGSFVTFSDGKSDSVVEVIEPVAPVDPNAEVVGSPVDLIDLDGLVEFNRVHVVIPEDVDALSICEILFESGVIDNVESFYQFVQDEEKATLLMEGDFVFEPAASYKAVLSVLSPVVEE